MLILLNQIQRLAFFAALRGSTLPGGSATGTKEKFSAGATPKPEKP
jgi:hypothetical protein